MSGRGGARRPRELTPLRKLVLAVEAHRAADDAAGVAFREALRVGDIISWEHAGHERTAEILWVSDGGWEHARLKVRSPHGRDYFVNASLVLSRLVHDETPASECEPEAKPRQSLSPERRR